MGIYSLSDLTPHDSFAVQEGDNFAKGQLDSCYINHDAINFVHAYITIIPSSCWLLLSNRGLTVGTVMQIFGDQRDVGDHIG